jgi:hypothetical protein
MTSGKYRYLYSLQGHKMKYSIVIPHLSNSSSIELCLKYIKENSLYENEIICIPDESDVYYAFNKGVFTSQCDTVVLLNDDMFVSKNWDRYIPIYSNQKTILTGYVVEPLPGPENNKCIKYDCGSSNTDFDYNKFQQFVNDSQVPDIKYDSKGWYMPIVVNKKSFVSYPNINKFPSYANDITLIDQIMPSVGFNFAQINMFVYHLQSKSTKESNALIKKCILSYHSYHIDQRLISLQCNVIDRFNTGINSKHEFLKYPIEIPVDTILDRALPGLFYGPAYNYHAILLLTDNCIPLNSTVIQHMFDKALYNIITIATVLNLDYNRANNISAICISRTTYEKMGKPSLSPIHNSSIEDELCYLAKYNDIQVEYINNENNGLYLDNNNESFYNKCIETLTKD